jgi:RND family efflux transporter MFP subunit
MNKILPLFLVTALFVLPLSTPALSGETLQFGAAERISSALEYQLDGVVEAAQKSTLSAQVSGRVEAINFDVDDTVNAGEVILQIRDNEYQARLQKARASLAEAKAGLKDAQLEFERASGLVNKKLISQSSFDKIKANRQAAEARVAASEANIAEAQEQLNNTIIRAPYSGVVVERHIELGETTHIGQKIMTGFSLQNLRVRTYVPQSLINAVRLHRSARVILLDGQSSIETESLTIFPYADAENHAFQVRANLTQYDQALFPGMLVKVAFIIDNTQRLMIPRGALVYRSEVAGVYVIDDNQQLAFRQVRPGHSFDDKIEILSGLDDGEKIALQPVLAGIELKAQWESR